MAETTGSKNVVNELPIEVRLHNAEARADAYEARCRELEPFAPNPALAEPTQFTEYRVVEDSPNFSEPMCNGGRMNSEKMAHEWLAICIRGLPAERNPRLQMRTKTLSYWRAAE